MHFLMPSVFSSHLDFKEWFSNPFTGMVEGSQEYNDSIVRRLHQVSCIAYLWHYFGGFYQHFYFINCKGASTVPPPSTQVRGGEADAKEIRTYCDVQTVQEAKISL